MKLILISILLSQCYGIDNNNAHVGQNNKRVLNEMRKNNCTDSPTFFKIIIDEKKEKRNCAWVGKGDNSSIQEKCAMAEVHKHCRKTCGNSECCEDSSSTFKVDHRSKTCEWVKLKPVKRCQYEGIVETCARTCTDCTPPPSLEQRFSAFVNEFERKVRELESQIDTLKIEVKEVDSLQTQVDSQESEVETLEDSVDELMKDNINLVSRITFLETIATQCCPSASPSNDPSSAPSDTPSALPSLTPSYLPSAMPSLPPGFIGCFKDTDDRALPVDKGDGKSFEQCSVLCSEYKYFGLQAGNWCSCGDDGYDKHGSSTECDCSSSSYQGDWVNCVYKH